MVKGKLMGDVQSDGFVSSAELKVLQEINDV